MKIFSNWRSLLQFMLKFLTPKLELLLDQFKISSFGNPQIWSSPVENGRMATLSFYVKILIENYQV
jgi:hypothetical protein